MMRSLTTAAVLGSITMLLSATGGTEELTSNVTLGADFRYRHELIDQDGADQRNRQRIRARVKLGARISDETSITMQLASGSDDPISTNQTLDDGFSTKGINLDLAYVTWKPAAVTGLTVTGGKVKNPFHMPGKTELIWDSDLNPEGAAASLDRSLGGFETSLTASWLWAEERSSGDDTGLMGLQGMVSKDVAGNVVVLGASYFDYTNTKTNSPLFDSTDGFGNSLTADNLYRYDYNEVELFAELTPAVLDGNLSVFADVVQNIAEDVDDGTSWLVGASAGSVKDRGDMKVRYSYRRSEADAIIAAFTDSDFCGGGTDGAGHEVNVSIGLARNVAFDASYFLNERGIDSDTTYHRVQADVQFKL